MYIVFKQIGDWVNERRDVDNVYFYFLGFNFKFDNINKIK